MYRALMRTFIAASLAVVLAGLGIRLHASTTWELGDLFISIGNGNFQVRNNLGASPPKETLSVGVSGDVTGGCAIDASLNAYLVNTTQSTITKRAFASPAHTPTLISNPEEDLNQQSIVFAANGDFYVGHLGGLIRRYVVDQATGAATQAEFTTVAIDSTDSFHLDMAADQRTIFYTSGGRNIRKVTVDINPVNNVATFGVSEPFMNLGTPNSNAARALRVLPPGAGNAVIGGIFVADKGNVKLVNAAGTSVVREYDAGSGSTSQDDWFALGLDITDVDQAGADLAFWAGDKSSGIVWRFNVGSSVATQSFQITAAAGNLRGLCLNAEPTSGQYSVVLKFDATHTTATATFAPGTQHEHRFGVELDCTAMNSPCGDTLTAVVNAREVISDGVCSGPNSETNTSDVDCGFKKYFTLPNVFTTDPLPPFGAPYVHGRAVYYHVKSWTNAQGNAIIPKPEVFVTISSESQLSVVTAALPKCSDTTPRALRIFRDPSDTEDDQFAEDLTDYLGVDEWVMGGRANRFMVAGRCATGSSAFKAPAQNRTFKAGVSIPIDLILKDAQGNPVANATLAPHSIATTIGSSGGITFVLGTPGSSPLFWTTVQPGKYSANLDTTGLPPSLLPYNLCVSDRIEPDPLVPSVALQQPLYQHNCLTFFLK